MAGSILADASIGTLTGQNADTNGIVMGTVTESGGRPLPGVRIILRGKVIKTPPSRLFLWEDTVVTDPDGKYLFDSIPTSTNIPDGTFYSALFEKEGYRKWSSGNLFVKSGETLTYNPSLEKVLSLSIRIQDGDSIGKALAGAKVGLTPTLGPFVDYWTGTSDGSGRLLIQGLNAGIKNITIAFEGYETQVIRKTLTEVSNEDSLLVHLRKPGQDSSSRINGKFPYRRDPQEKPAVFTSSMPEGHLILFGTVFDSTFAISGIPRACKNGTLMVDSRSLAITLTGPTTDILFNPSGLKKSEDKTQPQSHRGMRLPGMALFADPAGSTSDALGRR
jgi:hypothetical protein